MPHKVAIIDTDTAGGIIDGPGAPTFYIDNMKVSLDGDLVVPHGSSPHNAAIVHYLNNTKFYIGDKLIIVNDDLATCGHSVVASHTFYIGA